MRNLCVFLCMTVMVGLAGFAAAGQGSTATLDPADGWEQLSEGYWQRLTEDGKLQTVAMGPAGLERVLAGLKDELTTIVEDYLSYPGDEMLKVLQSHLDHIAAVEQNLEHSKVVKRPANELPAPWCDIDLKANAGSGPGCVNWANSLSSYDGSTPQQCLGLCTLYAYAYARRQLCNYSWLINYMADSEPSAFDEVVTAEASVSSSAARQCYSYGVAYINCPDYSYYQEEEDTTTSCGICWAACAEISHEDD